MGSSISTGVTAPKKRERKVKEKASAKKKTKAELAAADKLAFSEAVVFDSPALAAVKRMFN